MEILNLSGRLDAAEEGALRSIGIFPEAPEFRFHLANVYGKQEKYEMAEMR